MTLRQRLYLGWLRVRRWVAGVPGPGAVDWGGLRRLDPFSREFGYDRGLPVDRYYIEQFLGRHAADVAGRVLEVGDDSYTRRFGGHRVARSDVLHVDESNPTATLVADLAGAPHIPDDAFDTIILTQTLHLVYDARAAVRTLHRILKPGGVLLLTVPGITPVPLRTRWGHTWYWAFTTLSVQRMLAEEFGRDQVAVGSAGNVLAANAFLLGLATEELLQEELDAADAEYPVVITARALKSGQGDRPA